MATIKITLRDKTTKKLNEATCENLRKMISQKITCAEREMETLLWRLTFDPKNTSQQLGFEGIDQSEAITIRAEMADYYRKFNTDWNYGRRYTPVSEEQKELLKALKGDTYAYDTVMGHIQRRSFFNKGEVEEMVYLLSSAKENFQYGGVRRLGFKKEEANFLKSAAGAMSKVLETLSKTSR